MRLAQLGAVALAALCLQVGPAAASTMARTAVPAAVTAAEVSAASAQSAPGYCKDAKGVTVVVDFSALGGDIVIRCASGPTGPGFTGLDALQQAGFEPTGTQRDGLAFVCRILGSPRPDQPLAVEGNEGYKEACVQAPPTSAFWSYWYASNGGRWQFSSSGAKNRAVIPGGFEGWSFSLNNTAGSAPAPGVAAVRPRAPKPSPEPSPKPSPEPSPKPSAKPSPGPGTMSPRPTATSTLREATETPSSGDHGATSARPRASSSTPSARQETKRSGAAASTRVSPRASQSSGDSDKRGRKRAESPSEPKPEPKPKATRREGAAPTGPSAGGSTPGAGGDVVVTGELPANASDTPANGSMGATLLGAAVVVGLGVGAAITAWRRRSRRA